MPELPEVESVRLQLKHKVSGKTLKLVEIHHMKTIDHNPRFAKTLVGKTITTIDRVGKLLVFSFSNEANLFLLVHLKMTGQFFYVDRKGTVVGGGHSLSPSARILPGRHTRVAFHFNDSSTLYFNDMRLFGYIKLANAAFVTKALSGFGPEPIDPDFDCLWFATELKKKKALIKAVLLNQVFVAGLGNIYVDEALWRANVRPTRRANTLTKKEALELCMATGNVMRESIAVGGTTFQHFVDTGGENGNFSDYLQVFGKQGKSCSRCGTLIKKIRCAGRGTHYCPECQK